MNERLNDEPGLVNRSPDDEGKRSTPENCVHSEPREQVGFAKLDWPSQKRYGFGWSRSRLVIDKDLKIDALLSLEAYVKTYEP